MTKQRETRERVLDLIESLEVGDSIPSERHLAGDLGVSRLTVRAALDELVREGYLTRRRGAVRGLLRGALRAGAVGGRTSCGSITPGGGCHWGGAVAG